MEMDLSAHAATEGLGYLACKHARGLLVHHVLCLSAAGSPLGLLDQFTWTRPLEELGKRRTRNQRATAEKESQRWLEGLASVQRHLPHLQVMLIGDRESDLFDLFAAPRSDRLGLLVRVRDRRRRAEDSAQHLGEAVAQSPPRCQRMIEVPRADDRPARQADLTLRWKRLTICRPVNHRGTAPAQPVILWFLQAREEQPPEGVTPLCWLLATTVRIETIDEARRVLTWYLYRWRIERFHYVLKSGLGIERHQLATRQRAERLLATLSIIAWHVLWMAYEARRQPSACCTSIFTTDQWRVLHLAVNPRAPLPGQPPNLITAVRQCARLGGFLGRKRDGFPGVKTLWRGWRRLTDLLAGYRLAISHTTTSDCYEEYG